MKNEIISMRNVSQDYQIILRLLSVTKFIQVTL